MVTFHFHFFLTLILGFAASRQSSLTSSVARDGYETTATNVERIASDVDELRRDIWEERETNDHYLQHMVSFVDQLKTKLAEVECSLNRHEQKSLRCVLLPFVYNIFLDQFGLGNLLVLLSLVGQTYPTLIFQ